MRQWMHMGFWLLVSSLALVACDHDDDDDDDIIETPATDIVEMEEYLREELDDIETLRSFTLMVESESGRQFIYRRGDSSEGTVYESGSTSKWVTAAIILRLVENGVLSLDDYPHDYIDLWSDSNNVGDIQLHHLLSFTSGLVVAPPCLGVGITTLEACAVEIGAVNIGQEDPGNAFFYGETHLQVAGLMAIEAADVDDWQDVFDDFQQDTGLFPDSSYNRPSRANPRLASGMEWTATEYVGFLRALYFGEFLNELSLDTMFSDQIEDVSIDLSPARGIIDQDWHYGYGTWLECDADEYNCTSVDRVSSPAGTGSYPFIDFEHEYFGILAREDGLGSSFDEGYEIVEDVMPELEQWAEMANE